MATRGTSSRSTTRTASRSGCTQPTRPARDFPGQVSAPPKKPGKDAPPEETARWEQQRHQQSSQRICIEHAIAEPKQRRPLQRYLGRRDHFPQTALAIAGLVSDRATTR
jgi:hypothetical protein